MKFYLKKLLNLLLPPCCDLCNTLLKEGRLCQLCVTNIVKTIPCCQVCQASLEMSGVCGQCTLLNPAFNKVYTLGDYQGTLAKLITGLKFQSKLNYGRALSELWMKALPNLYLNDTLPTIIIPIPLHRKRLKERGFNQALEIAKPLAKHFHLKLDKFNCIRVKSTKPQLGLAKNQRKKNMAKAFKIKNLPENEHVVILDDVFTTGHTVNALAILLKNKKGIKRIDIWCCARTQWKD